MTLLHSEEDKQAYGNFKKMSLTLSVTQYMEQDLNRPTHTLCFAEIFYLLLYSVEFLLGQDEVH